LFVAELISFIIAGFDFSRFRIVCSFGDSKTGAHNLLAAIRTWVSQMTGADFIFLLAGIAMGLFYGFDGWKGSTKNLPLKNSPRVKSFLWAIGAAFFVFIADVKRVFPDLNKERALLAYLTAFFVSSFLTIMVWGLSILVKFAWIRRFDTSKYPGPPFTPFADYIRYGYEYHYTQYCEALKRQEAREEQYLRTFLPSYITQLSYAIAATHSYRESRDPGQKRQVEVSILQSIIAVVREYYGKVPELEVNANYMVAYRKDIVTPDMLACTKFAFGDPKRYEFFLALAEYGQDRGRENFVLPVENKNNRGAIKSCLPGAPLAFLMNDTAIVDDVAKIRYSKGIPAETIDEISTYFEGKNFRSFGSLNIAGAGKQLGVVNVESNQTHVFGRTQKQKKEITSFLHPFCSLLAFVIAP
jgi:hypothetical protein